MAGACRRSVHQRDGTKAMLARCGIEPPDFELCEALAQKSVVTGFEMNWWLCRTDAVNCSVEETTAEVCGEQGWCADDCIDW